MTCQLVASVLPRIIQRGIEMSFPWLEVLVMQLLHREPHSTIVEVRFPLEPLRAVALQHALLEHANSSAFLVPILAESAEKIGDVEWSVVARVS